MAKDDLPFLAIDLPISQENQEVVIQPTPQALWFEAFVRNTDQKSMTVGLLSGFLDQMYGDHKKPLSFMDVGCSKGRQGYDIISRLPKNAFNYIGIDAEARDLEEARRLFQIGQIPAKFVLGNCFNEEDHNKLGLADIVLISHVAYYTRDLRSFTKSYTNKINSNGLALFIHNVPESDTRQLRNKYGTDLTLDVTAFLEMFLDNLGMKAVTYRSHLHFPGNVAEYWGMLSQASFSTSFITENQDLQDAKHLLEFIVQQPLEVLQEKGLLDAYLTDVKEKLERQSNCLYLESRLQVVNAPHSQKEFLLRFDEAFNDVTQKVGILKQEPIKEHEFSIS